MIDVPFLQNVTLKKENIPSFSAYPYCLPAIRTLQSLAFHPNVTFIIGENGTGKSTLLEGIAIALGFNAEGGTKNFRFSTNDSHSSLHEYLRISKVSIHQMTVSFFALNHFITLLLILMK